MLERFVGLCGGTQVWILALVGFRANEVLREQLGHGLVVAGTSAGATVLATSPDGALRAALGLAGPANPVLLTYEKLARPRSCWRTWSHAVPGWRPWRPPARDHDIGANRFGPKS